METRKSSEKDLENKRTLFLEIGLAIALSVVIAAFASNRKERIADRMDVGTVVPDPDPIAPTRHPEKRTEPAGKTITVAEQVINVVRDDARITTEMNFAEFDEGAIVVAPAEVKEKTVEDIEFVKVEHMPSFEGGDLAGFRAWVMSRLVFPQAAVDNGVSGRVTLSFMVDRDGSLTDIRVLQSPNRSLSEEAARVLGSSPGWTPGRQRNQTVRVRYTLPVDFRIQR